MMTDVIDFQERKKEQQILPQKIKKNELIKMMADVIHGIHHLGSPFTYKFHVIEPENGVRLVLLEHENEVCEIVSENTVVNAILAYSVQISEQGFEAVLLSHSDAKNVKDFWISSSSPIEEPKFIRQKSEPGFTYRRLDFDFLDCSYFDLPPTPNFDQLFSYTSNIKALKAWIGSLFFLESDRQQYVWIYGGGKNGKSALGRLLKTTLGQSLTVQQPPKDENQFWTYGLMNKRLVVFPDCNKYGFVATGLFKQLTGGDAVRIERKYGDSFTTDLVCKILFFSNSKPNISSEKADMRRIIYVQMGVVPETEVDINLEDKLIAEYPSFFNQCVMLFREMTSGSFGPIPAEAEEISSIVKENEEIFEIFFQENFKVHEKPLAVDGTTLPIYRWPFMTPAAFNNILQKKFTSKFDQRDLRSWIERTHGLTSHVVTPPRFNALGLKEKPIPERRYLLLTATST